MAQKWSESRTQFAPSKPQRHYSNEAAHLAGLDDFGELGIFALATRRTSSSKLGTENSASLFDIYI